MTRLQAEVARIVRPRRGAAPLGVVAGLSGGADSVALLHALRAVPGLRLVAAHLDHGLRPDSARDAAFCRALCRRMEVPLTVGRADVRARAARDGSGIEAAAREERRAFLEGVRAGCGARWIALAHTRDDQAETVLLRLLRGSGSAGLGAMRTRAGRIVRPLLGVARADVVAHLSAHGLDWREDPTNADPAILRNRVRHELIPYLEARFNPALREALARTASVLAAEADVLRGTARAIAVRRDGRAAVLPRAPVVEAPRAIARLSVRAAIRSAGGLRGVSLAHVDAVVGLAGRASASGRRLPLPGGREAAVHFDEIRVGPAAAPAPPFDVALEVPGRAALPDGRLVVAEPRRRGGAGVVALPEGPLTVRNRRPGDRVVSDGREMSLRRFLMARRVPAAERDRLPVIAAGRTVVWVHGQPVDPVREPARHARVSVTAGATA